MKQEILKSYLLRDKGFLKELYEGPNPLKNARILNNASDTQLNTLIYYLHFLTCGDIKITKANFNEIEKCKKLHLLKSKVEKMSNVKFLINGPRAEKLLFLKKLSIVYPNLLYGLFNLT